MAATISVPRARSQREAVTPATVTRGAKAFNRVCAGVLIALALLWLVPLAWTLDTAIKPEALTTKLPLTWFPDSYSMDGFRQVLDAHDILNWYANSAVTSVLISASTIVIASMAGFALSRVPFRGRGLLFWFVLVGIMIPQQVLIVPLFKELNSIGLINTYWAVMLPQIPTPIAVFVFKQFFDGIPKELADAARIDGAGYLRVYWRVWMPLSRPVIAAVAIFTFVWSWNNFLWPFIVITSTRSMTLPVGLATVQSAYGIHYAQIMASAVLGGLPLLVVFLLFQRQIVQGIAGTGLKG